MDGGHQAVAEAEVLMHDLDRRGQAVGGAGRGGDDGLLGRIIDLLVHAHDDHGVHALARRGNDHLFGPAVQMPGQTLAVLDGARGFHGKGHAQAFPLPFPGLAAGHCDMASVDDDTVVIMIHFTGKRAVGGVVFEQVGQGGVVRAGVDGRDLKILIVGQQAQQITADAAEAVHSQFYGHGCAPCVRICLEYFKSEML